MSRIFLSILLSSILVLPVFAEGGPVQYNPADVCAGACPPNLSPWNGDPVNWTAMPPALMTFARAGSGIIGNYFYTFGAGPSNVATALAFNLVTETWETSTPPQMGRNNWQGVVVDGSLYLVGGYVPAYINSFQKFTPVGGGPGGIWEHKAPYPRPACGVACGWDRGNYIYAAGGNPISSQAYRYDIAADRWSPIAPLPAATSYCGGAWVEGHFHVLGGIETPTGHVAYDPLTNTWSNRAPLPAQVHFTCFNVTENDHIGEQPTRIFLVGGGGGYGIWPATNNVFIYDPMSNSWSAENPLPLALGLISARYAGEGVVICAGGYSEYVYYDNTCRGTDFPLNINFSAPASPTGFAVVHHQLQLRASLSWTNPTVMVSGSPLTDLDSARIYRGDSLIHTLTNVQIGQPSNWSDDNLPAAGMYEYSVICYNDSGRGQPAEASAWIGLDTPGAPGGVSAVPDTGGAMLCVITWNEPLNGAHGGYWLAGSWNGQKIYRNGVEIADLPGSNTAYTDAPAAPNWYTFGVAYYNSSGTGLTGNAPEVYVGGRLSGEFDVGGGLNHFPDVISAASSINNMGVAGPVVFNVYPGTYPGEILLDNVPGASRDNTVTFSGVSGPGGQRPIVTNISGHGFCLLGVSYFIIEGFEFTQCGGYGGIYTGYNAVSGDSSHHILISGNYFHDMVVDYNQYCYECHHITLCGNEVDGGSHGFYVRCCPHSQVYNNMIYGQTYCGFKIYGSANSRCCYNSIYSQGYFTFLFSSNNDNSVVVNNVFWNCSSEGRAAQYSEYPLLHDYNCLYAPDGYVALCGNSRWCRTLLELQAVSGQEAHSVSANPRWVSLTDLHLTSVSPCLEAGAPIHSITDDFDGELRDRDTPCMGCDELVCALRITLTPHNPPIVIPAGGGIFQFDAEVQNAGDSAISFDAWTEVILPGGAHLAPLILRSGLLILAGQIVTRAASQLVPAAAPPGEYTYIGSVGIYPGTITDADSFRFSKLVVEGSANHNRGWETCGWFDEEKSQFTAHDSQSTVLSSIPNPFNQRTVISFQLSAAGEVKLTIHNITGREAAVLVNGHLPLGFHEIAFEGRDLSSGVYFARMEAGGEKWVRKLLLVK